MNAAAEPEVRAGWIDPAVAAELPGLALTWCSFPATPGRSPPDVRARLRALSDAFRGPQAIALRRQAIPHAYRVLFRHIGFDPDQRRTPVEAVALERMQRGGFPSRSLVDDALLIATVETRVGVWALDAARVAGELGIAGRARLVVADATGPVADLFAAPGPGHAVTQASRDLALYAILAPGVPDLAAEEALWTAWDIICA